MSRLRPAARPRALVLTVAALLLALLAAAPASAFQGPWTAPADTLSAAGQTAVDPQVAVAPDGTTTAVWYRSNGTNNIVQASTRSPGGSFGAPVDLSGTGQSAADQQIAVAPDGTTTVVWGRSNGTESIVQASTRPPGGVFGAPVNLSAPGQDALYPQLAIASDGTTIVVWERYDGANDIVQASTRPPGGVFGAPVNLSASGGGADVPQIAFGPDGAAAVTWTRSNGADNIVQASARPAGGTFSSPVDLSAPGYSAANPEVAVAANGTVTIVWSRFDGVNTIVQASTKPPGGIFAAPVDLSVAGQSAANPQIAVAPDGSATAIWSRSNGANSIVQAAARPAGGSFAAPVDLSAPGQSAFDPRLVIASDGTATAAWRRSNGANFVVQAATRPLGLAFGGAIDLSAVGQDAIQQQLAVAPDGAVSAVWSRSDGTSGRAQSATTANPPALLSAPKLVGTAAAGSTLSCDGGAWTGAQSVATSWLRDGAVVTNGATYAVAVADQGRALVCRGRATNAFGAVEAQSLPVVVATPAAPAPDKTAPALTVLTKTKLTRVSFLRNGVTVRVSADEPATVLAELIARAKGAKISAVPFNLALGSRTAKNVRNTVTIKIKPNRSLVGKARRFTIRLRLTAEDAAGNRRVTGKTIRVAV